jgi:hypothetical protein
MSDLVLNRIVLLYVEGAVSLRAFQNWASERALATDFRDPALNKVLGLLTVADEFSEDALKERLLAAVLPTASHYRKATLAQAPPRRSSSARLSGLAFLPSN